MEAEPVLIVDGVRSDASLHEDMLSDSDANAYARQVAIKQAAASGLSPEQIGRLYAGHNVQKVDFAGVLASKKKRK